MQQNLSGITTTPNPAIRALENSPPTEHLQILMDGEEDG